MKNPIFFLILAVFICARPAMAYVDPGSGQLVWQFLQAALIGGLFFVGQAVRRVTSAFKKKE